jgi:antitoxin (DNA-binding transcriptional repressor) of toxin-antitoxin stability system
MAKVTIVDIGDAAADFAHLVQEAMMGQEVVIARDNTPLLKLVLIEGPVTPRKPGSAEGQVWTSADFDATPDEFGHYV